MRTFIISDLHLGNGGDFDAFAGADELPAFLDRVGQEPAHIFVNGDGVDFLMNMDALKLDRARATQQAQAIVADPATAGVMRAFGRVLARGGEVTIRLGNHDLELSLPEVQSVLRGSLEQPDDVAKRLQFQLGKAPAIIDIGGARILVTHGEHYDKWNKVEYAELAKPETYKYTAGSTLVKEIMNPLMKQYRMRFMNFLKPDFSGGALTAFGINPGIVKEIFKGATIDIVAQLIRRAGMAAAFNDEDVDLGLTDRLEGASLTADERKELDAILSDGPASFADDDGSISNWGVKIARAGLKAYTGLQRGLAKKEGANAFLNLAPDDTEWGDAKRLAAKENCGAVVYGHTHAARWRDDGIVFANTGTWIWLMELPSLDADSDTWLEFLMELKENPTLDRGRQNRAKTLSRFTAVSLEPHADGGAQMTLTEWKNEALEVMGQTRVAPTRV